MFTQEHFISKWKTRRAAKFQLCSGTCFFCNTSNRRIQNRKLSIWEQTNAFKFAFNCSKLWCCIQKNSSHCTLTKWSKCRASLSGQHKRALWKGHGLRYGATVLQMLRQYRQLLPPKNGHHWGLHAFYESEKDEKTEVPAAPLWKGCNESAECHTKCGKSRDKNKHAEKKDTTKKWVKNGMSSMWLSIC